MIGVLWVLQEPNNSQQKPLGQSRCGRWIFAFPAQIVLPAWGVTVREIRTLLCRGKKEENKEKKPKLSPQATSETQGKAFPEDLSFSPLVQQLHTNSPGFVFLGKREGKIKWIHLHRTPGKSPRNSWSVLVLCPVWASPTLWRGTIWEVFFKYI